MDAQQLDSLLKSKVNRSRSAKRVSRVAVAVLCLLLLVGSGVGIYHLASREPQEASNVSSAPEPDPAELSSDARQPEASAPDAEQTPTNEPSPAPEPNTEPSNGAQEEELYTHCLQMVWFEEPLSALPEELNISVSYADEPVTQFTLSPDNGWQYTWTDAYSADDLVLQGDFPQDIFAVFSVSGQNFTVTGIYSDPLVTEDTEASDQKPGEEPEKRELPRTGVVWPLGLLLAGLALVIAGVSQKRARSGRE